MSEIMHQQEMSDVTSVEEVRRGLFRISWEPADPAKKLIKGPHIDSKITRKQVELCGTQLGRAVIISCQILQDEMEVTIEMQSSVWDRESKIEKEPRTNHQKFKESTKSKASTTFYDNLTPPPFKMWLENEVTLCPPKLSDFHKWDGFDINQSNYNGKVPIVLWVDFRTNEEVRQRNTNKGLAKMLHSQTHCDVNFQFKDGQSVGAHIVILSAANPLFADMFQSSLKESSSPVVVIEDVIDVEVFKQLLDYLYTSKPPKVTKNKEINTMLLYEAADEYDVVDLKKECIELLLIQLEVENAVELLIWSKLHSIPELYEEAMTITVRNYKELASQPSWLDFMTKHPELCLEINKEIIDLLKAQEYTIKYSAAR